MPKTKSEIAVVALNEAVWHTADGEWRVTGADTNAHGDEEWLVRTPGGDDVLMSAMAVFTAMNDAERDTGAALLPDIVEISDDAWWGVPDHVRWPTQHRAALLKEAATGNRRGDIVSGSANGYPINPRYDPANTTLEERLQRLSEELIGQGEKGSSVRTIKEQIRRLRANRGRASCLVHGNFGKRRDLASQADAGLKAVVRRYVLDRSDRETITRGNLEADFKNHHADLLREVPDGVWKAVLNETATQFGLYEPAPTRRSKSIRTPERQGMWETNRPYESLQLDSTPLDLFAADSNGRIVKNLQLVWALDPFCSKVRALRIVAADEPFTTDTVRQLLSDTVTKRMHGQPFVPGEIGASPLLATHVGLGSIVVDRGAQFVGLQTLGQNAGFSTHVVIAPPGRGDRKPHVESRFRGMALLLQLLPGAKGANLTERGHHPERHPMLRVDQLTAILTSLVEGVIHNTPIRRLHPETNAMMSMTPNQIEARYYRTNGLIEVDAEYYRALELCTVRQRVIGDDGIRVQNRRYWDPALEEVRQALRRKQDDKDRKVSVYFDEGNPEAIIVRDPSGHPLLVPQIGASTVPVLGDLLARDIFEDVLGGAVGDRSVDELKELIIGWARDSAIEPTLRARTSRESRRRKDARPKRSSKRLGRDLTGVFDDLLGGTDRVE